MSNSNRWSKKADTNQLMYRTQDGSITLKVAIEYLNWLAEDLQKSVAILVSDTDEKTKEIHSFDFWIEPGYEEFGISHDVSFDELYRLLLQLTNEGYDLRSEWRNFRSHLRAIWQHLPIYYEGLNKYRQGNRTLPDDYDPNNPFPQYSIPTDIDEEKIPRWSKTPDWKVFNPKETSSGEFDDGRYQIEALIAHLRGITKLIVEKTNYMKTSSQAEIGELWFELTFEESGIGSNRIAFDETDFYKGGTLHKDLYDTLCKLTEEGYDVRGHWRELRELFSTIWKTLPDMYTILVKHASRSYDYKPADYDPNNPFPRYPIPTDIDE